MFIGQCNLDPLRWGWEWSLPMHPYLFGGAIKEVDRKVFQANGGGGKQVFSSMDGLGCSRPSRPMTLKGATSQHTSQELALHCASCQLYWGHLWTKSPSRILFGAGAAITGRHTSPDTPSLMSDKW